jgi:hypothetical protein
MLHTGSKESTFEFFNNFETQANMLGSQFYRDNADFYILGYDTEITSRDKNLVRRAISNIVDAVVIGSAPDITSAIIWKEMERRAVVTANRILLPFFNRSGTQFRGGGS